MKTIVMELWHSADALDGADYAVLEVTQDMAAELLVLIAWFRKTLTEEPKLSSIVYRDLYIPTFFGEGEDGYGDRLDSLIREAAQSEQGMSVLLLDERIEIPEGGERLLEYPKLWVREDRVFWRGSYRHEEVIVETAPLMRETLQQIAKVRPC